MTHQLHPTLLREYDVRGIIGETLSEQDALMLGQGLGTLTVRDGGTLAVVARDGRLSSPALEQAVVDGLRSTGLTVQRLGLGPSPMLYYGQVVQKADVAVMVTGSHNPPNHNGFKMMKAGKPFFGEDVRRLGALIAAGDFEHGAGTVTDVAVQDSYIARLVQDWDGGARALKVVWDAGNGAAGAVLPQLVAHLPGHHTLLYAEVDGTFPNHHPDPTDPHTLEDLIQTVREQQADLGFAFDGDGDRLGVVDNQGRILWGDQILQILAEDVLRHHPKATVIADIKASQSLFDEITRMGGQPLMWKTGHSLIKTKMAETKAPLAGEMSGHLFFADHYYGFDDALYAAVRFLGIVARMTAPLSARVDRIPVVHNSPEIRFDCAEEDKFRIVTTVRQRLDAEGATVSTIDGVRVTRPGGWWLLRASNTQAVLVARAEGDTPARRDALLEELNAYVESARDAL